jgi:cytochrome o ubiquinol oxidase operon protein cyoD
MSDTEFDANEAYAHEYEHDHAPGDLPEESTGHWIRNYVIGLVLAAILTAMSFGVAAATNTPHFLWGPSIPVALIVLAIAQMGVHLVFFLHITTGPDNTNNVLALAFGVLIVFLVVGGSIWIMSHLNGRTMAPPTMSQAMQMQQ